MEFKVQKSLFIKFNFFNILISESMLIFKPVNFRTVNRRTAETHEKRKYGN